MIGKLAERPERPIDTYLCIIYKRSVEEKRLVIGRTGRIQKSTSYLSYLNFSS